MDDFEEYEEEEFDEDGFDDDFGEEFDPLSADACLPVEVKEGLFGELLEKVEEYNNGLLEYIQEAHYRGELTDSEANMLWDNESVDLEGKKAEATEFEQILQNTAEKILALRDSGELSDFQAELRLAKLGEKKARFERDLELHSVGMSMEKIFDMADDAGHIIEDTYDPGIHDLRKKLSADLAKIPRSERKALIDNLHEEGEIDDDQYSYLCIEFL